MDKNTIIDEAVEKAYKNLTGIVDLNILIVGKYFNLIITENLFKEHPEYCDEIIDKLFWKFCSILSNKVTNDDIEFIMYKSFVNNDPSETMINDCFKIVNNILKSKKSSNDTTLYNLLDQLKANHNKNEIEKSLDTIFDILLDYYSIIRK